MSWVRALASRQPWALETVLVGMAVLVLAVGFCVFDSHDASDGHGVVDLCLGMIAVSLAVVLPGLPLTGLTSAYPLAPLPSLFRHVPAPPPKSGGLA